MAAKKRIIQTNQDQASVDSTLFNAYAGAQKNMEVGRHHLPMPVSASAGVTTYSTDASTLRSLPGKGLCLAVYNNATSVGAVTLGNDNTITALAPGAVDANGNVGVPCAPGEWTFLACYDKTFVKSTAATLLVFIIADDSSIQ